MTVSATSHVTGGSPRRPDPTLAGLTPVRRRLVALVQSLYFGTLHGLSFRNGELLFDPPPKAVCRVKLNARDIARPQAGSRDFALKHEWVEFFEELDARRDGVVLVIEIAHGLPLFFEIEQPFSF